MGINHKEDKQNSKTHTENIRTSKHRKIIFMLLLNTLPINLMNKLNFIKGLTLKN
jgi:hypothetical protein